MTERLNVAEYFRRPETLRPQELVYGVLREPPAPFYSHQAVVTRVTQQLANHVTTRALGLVCVSPIDVVLDGERALVVQPDVIFVSEARRAIVRDRVWGPPELVIEVLSTGTARHDRTDKLEWYRHYGVQECWLVDPDRQRIEIVDCASLSPDDHRTFKGRDFVRSRVLPALELRTSDLFDWSP